MKYCSDCGAPVGLRVPEGDLLPRFVCDSCGIVHYQNPKIVVGCVPEYEGRIVICKRAIEPRVGYWTVPAGFLENGETLQQGAAREAHEEALAKVEILSLLTIVHVIHAHQVHALMPGWSRRMSCPGRTLPSPVPTTPCVASWKTGPPDWTDTTSLSSTAVPGRAE
jgi:hypothetical protein